MNFNREITCVREQIGGANALAIMISTPDDGSLSVSGVYNKTIDKSASDEVFFNTNTTILDVVKTEDNIFWCVDDEGHLFCTKELAGEFLPLMQELDFKYNPNFISKVFVYRLSYDPLNAVWSDGQRTIIVDDVGSVWDIQGTEIIKYTACPQPLSFFGTQAKDLYLFGRKAQLWHFDGRSWTQVNLPDTGHSYLSIYGGVTLLNGETVFVTDYGVVFKGTPDKEFTILDVPKKQYTGIAMLEHRVFVTVRSEGLFEVTDFDGFWQLHMVSPARLPLSLNAMGKGSCRALYMSSAMDIGKPHFVIAEPGESVGSKIRVYSWEITVDE